MIILPDNGCKGGWVGYRFKKSFMGTTKTTWQDMHQTFKTFY